MSQEARPSRPRSFVIVKTSEHLEAPRIGASVHLGGRQRRGVLEFVIDPWGKGDSRRFQGRAKDSRGPLVGDWDPDHTFEIQLDQSSGFPRLQCTIRKNGIQHMTTGTWTADEDGPDR